jgi:hypothetical protein
MVFKIDRHDESPLKYSTLRRSCFAFRALLL